MVACAVVAVSYVLDDLWASPHSSLLICVEEIGVTVGIATIVVLTQRHRARKRRA
ncbi:MAG: hypothetical protein ACYC19_01515 [Acidimicrobiales bacterium]